MIDSELRRDLDEIEKTRFWKEYCVEIDRARKIIVNNLCKVNISKPVTYGDVLQEKLRIVESILGLPDKMIGTDIPE
jgi:hypothetical protein